jgi:integrase
MKRGRSISPPAYRPHKPTGQARVTIGGKTYYLGKYGTPESKQKYRQTLADKWMQTDATPRVSKPENAAEVTVRKLAIEFGKFAKRKYGDSHEWRQIQSVLKVIRETYGYLPVAEFCPIRFENYRLSLVDQGLSRSVVKRKSNYVVRMFKQGVKLGIIPAELWQRLLAVGPVEMQCKPPVRVKPADPAMVEATQDELTPTLRDMVKVHRLIGARPSEVCNMRPCDIDRSGDIWIYTPPTHKTENYGHSRHILIGPQAQEILKRYLLRDSQSYCFTPAESYEQHYRQRNESRKTPASCGNGPKPRKPKTFKPNYNKDSYRRAIERAALRAFPMPKDVKRDKKKSDQWKAKYVWKPNQLRHLAASSARKEFDLETAQILLGHSNKATTEKFYAEIDQSRAVDFARAFG